MRISTEIASIARQVGEHKAVELCGKAGFDGWDLSMFSMCPNVGAEPVFSGGFLMQNPLEHDLGEAEFFHAMSQ